MARSEAHGGDSKQRRHTGLLDLPSELIQSIHLLALNPSLPLVSSTIQQLINSTGPRFRAQYIHGRWKEIFGCPMYAVLEGTMCSENQNLPLFELSPKFVLSHRISHSLPVLKWILRMMVRNAGHAIEVIRVGPLDPCEYLQHRQLPVEVIHFLFHLSPPRPDSARRVYEIHRDLGNAEVAAAIRECGIPPGAREIDSKSSDSLEAPSSTASERPWNPESRDAFQCSCGWRVDPTAFSLALPDAVSEYSKPNGFHAPPTCPSSDPTLCLLEQYKDALAIVNRELRGEYQWLESITLLQLRHIWTLLRFNPRLGKGRCQLPAEFRIEIVRMLEVLHENRNPSASSRGHGEAKLVAPRICELLPWENGEEERMEEGHWRAMIVYLGNLLDILDGEVVDDEERSLDGRA